MSILVTLYGDLDFGQNFRKISILDKIMENFRENLQKSQF